MMCGKTSARSVNWVVDQIVIRQRYEVSVVVLQLYNSILFYNNCMLVLNTELNLTLFALVVIVNFSDYEPNLC